MKVETSTKWELLELGSQCDKISLNGIKIKQKQYLTDGKYPVVDQGQNTIGGYSNDKTLVVPGNPPFIVFGDHTKVKKFINFNFVAGADGVKVLKPHADYNPKFFYYFLYVAKFPDKGYARHFQFLEKVLIPKPSIQEQDRIVAKIEELFSELDKGIENLKTAQQQLKVYRQAVLKWAFSDTSHSVIETVENCCSHIIDCLHSTAKFVNNGFYCIDTTCIENGKILFDRARYVNKSTFQDRISRLKPEFGDILFAREGTVATTAIVPKSVDLCLGQRMMMFRLKKTILPQYFMYYLQSPIFKSQYRPLILGTTAPHLNIRDIRKFTVPRCDIQLQKELVAEIESRLSVCDKIEETITPSLQQAEALKQSILKQAFEGKLVKSEPAPVHKPKSTYFYQVQLLATIAAASKQRGISHGEMTLAKYAYLLDKVYKIPTYYDYNRWHLGPYPPEIKKAVNNAKFFARVKNTIEVKDMETLAKYPSPFQQGIEQAIEELTGMLSSFKGKERSRQTELLATVCKVIEDIQSTDLEKVRHSMAEWVIDLPTTRFKSKAEKFTSQETEACLKLIHSFGWPNKLITRNKP